MADATTMLSICDPVHIVLIRTDTAGDTTLVSSYFLDWRSVLCAPSGKTSVAVELLGVGKSFLGCGGSVDNPMYCQYMSGHHAHTVDRLIHT